MRIMSITDWFDPMNVKHIRAYRHICEIGVWPEGFIPKGTEFPPMWFVTITQECANYWIRHRIMELED
jgi:hypothetical protein